MLLSRCVLIQLSPLTEPIDAYNLHYIDALKYSESYIYNICSIAKSYILMDRVKITKKKLISQVAYPFCTKR